MARKPRFEYKERDPADVKKRAERQGGNFDSIFKRDFPTWSPKDGSNNIRILPPTYENHDHYGYSIFVHSYIGADKSSYLCPKKMLNKKCPICEAEAAARKDGDKDDADELKATERFVVWMLDRDGDDPRKPLLWSMSWTMDRDFVALCIDEKSGKVLAIDHPDEGFDLSFTRKGQKLNTRYIGLRIDRESSPISTSAKRQDTILDYITENPLDSVLQFYPAAHLEEVISGTNPEKDEDLDDDKPRKRKRGDDDDDDDDDRPAKKRARDDDDDDEPAPRKTSRTRLAKDDDDDDTPQIRRGGNRKGPEDDDDDEDAPPPRKRARADDDDDDAPAPRKKARARDDDDDDDAPPFKTNGKKRAAADDDDDEDDDRPRRTRKPPVDEDDEDDRPRRRR